MKSFTLTRTNRNTGLVIKAVCLQLEEDTFILQKGSIISPFELKGLSKRMKEMRSNAKIDNSNILLEDVTFKSLYDAACFVIGTNASDKWFKEDK